MPRVIASELSRALAHEGHKESATGHEPHSRAEIIIAIMIASLRGMLLEKRPNQIVIDVQGVGYDVAIPISTYAKLPDTGVEVKVQVHTHVREDAIALF